MEMHPTVEKHLDEIRAAAERYGVEKLEIFGSAMTPEFDEEKSDVDFIVHYPQEYQYGPFGQKLFDLEEELSKILGRTAQLVMTKALNRDYFREAANRTRTTIYDSGTPGTPVEGYSKTLRVYS